MILGVVCLFVFCCCCNKWSQSKLLGLWFWVHFTSWALLVNRPFVPHSAYLHDDSIGFSEEHRKQDCKHTELYCTQLLSTSLVGLLLRIPHLPEQQALGTDLSLCSCWQWVFPVLYGPSFTLQDSILWSQRTGHLHCLNLSFVVCSGGGEGAFSFLSFLENWNTSYLSNVTLPTLASKQQSLWTCANPNL